MAGVLFAQTPEKAAGVGGPPRHGPGRPGSRWRLLRRGCDRGQPEQARDGVLAAKICERTARALGLVALAQTQR
ncbi:hypothetical protein ACFYXC_20610 [Streptomyces sp. NPDC002701]|uniref:hypothetical protein n=1 Tax=Streptomyces sp. NPDC002701 TaxID=3364661 RepID=UPI003680F58E